MQVVGFGFCISISLQCPGEEADFGGEWPHGASRASDLAQNLYQRLWRCTSAQIHRAIRNLKVTWVRQGQPCGPMACAFTEKGPVLGLMLLCHLLKMLNNFQT